MVDQLYQTATKDIYSSVYMQIVSHLFLTKTSTVTTDSKCNIYIQRPPVFFTCPNTEDQNVHKLQLKVFYKPSVLLDPDADLESTLSEAIVQISLSVPCASSLWPTKFTTSLNVSTPKGRSSGIIAHKWLNFKYTISPFIIKQMYEHTLPCGNTLVFKDNRAGFSQSVLPFSRTDIHGIFYYFTSVLDFSIACN